MPRTFGTTHKQSAPCPSVARRWRGVKSHLCDKPPRIRLAGAKMFLQGQWQERGTAAEVIHPTMAPCLTPCPWGRRYGCYRGLDGLEQGRRSCALPTHRRVEILRAPRSSWPNNRRTARLISREEGKVLAEGHRGRARDGDLDLSADAARDLHGETVPLDATPGGVGKLGSRCACRAASWRR